MSETGEIGYVAAFPIFFVLKPLNMFVAGARSVNPDANVSVVFTNSWFDPGLELQAANALIDSGADVLTYDLSSPTVPEVAEQRGAHFIGYGYDDARTQAPEAWAGGAIYNWGPLFVEAIQEMQAGTWVPGYVYGGYSDGWLDIADFGDDVSQGTRQAITDLIAEISAGNVDVFAGPLVDPIPIAHGDLGQAAVDGHFRLALDIALRL